jgi:ABC-type transport system involved in multi-copper enzyme maturation permease subunit
MSFPVLLRRELRALFALPQTYAIAGAFLLISGVFFANILISTQSPDLGQFYSNIATTFVVLLPIVAMRSFAEERRSGALDLTLSWPVSRAGLVVAKFVANTAFAWALVSVSWLYVRVVSGLAPIDGARAAGGYFGLLFLILAFSALALMVSARASSPTAAAFLGFGLLLFLWILDYAPGWIGDVVEGLSPSRHFESFPRGVVYLGDVAWFLAITAVGLGLAIAALGRARPGRRLGSLVRRGGALAGVAVVLSATPALARRVDGEVDLTASKRNTIAPATRDVLRRVHGSIHLTGFVQPISREATALRNTVKQYRSAGADMALTVVDPDAQPGLAHAAGVTNYNHYVVEIDGRRETIDDVNQITLTSAISRLARPDRPSACFTVGHGERDVDAVDDAGASGVAAELRRAGYDVRSIAPAGTGGADALRRCTVVVVAGPRVPFLPAELTLLGDYAAAEGRLVVLAEGLAGTAGQLNGLLRPWGVQFGSGVVRDLSTLAGDPTSVVSSDFPAKHPVIAALDTDGVPVVLTNTLPVQTLAADDPGTAPHVTPLVQSSRRSQAGTGPAGDTAAGPLTLAAAVDASRVEGQGAAARIVRTRIGVVGTAEVATNRFSPYLGNRTLVSALVQWAGQDNDIVSAHRDPGGAAKLALTRAQKHDVVQRGIVLPTLAVLIPLPITLLRLKRG